MEYTKIKTLHWRKTGTPLSLFLGRNKNKYGIHLNIWPTDKTDKNLDLIIMYDFLVVPPPKCNCIMKPKCTVEATTHIWLWCNVDIQQNQPKIKQREDRGIRDRPSGVHVWEELQKSALFDAPL